MIDAAGMRVIKAIADEGSFTNAAVALGYSQPAISQMVRRMEQRTGTALVERLGRTVRLTEAGQVLARHAGTVLAAIDAAEEEVAAIAGLRSGRVRLMSFPSSSATLVPRALAKVKQDSPDVAVRLTEAEPPESLTAIRSGECDIAIAFTYEGSDLTRRSPDLEGLVIHPLLEDPVKLVVPPGHQYAGAPMVHMRNLSAERWIAGCPRCRGHLVHLCQQAGFGPEVDFETEDYVAVLGLVAEGLGVALVPDLILQTARTDDVSVVPVEPASSRRIFAVTTPDLMRVPPVACTIEALISSAESVRAG
ncbi:MAG: LysR family transcriptional regulator [Micrococcales bacterium]|nr:LysR family transcriptional regulator [Micrococcales bacterium]